MYYLYNSAKLPAIPKADGFDYAVVVVAAGTNVDYFYGYCILATKPLQYLKLDIYALEGFVPNEDCSYIVYSIDDSRTEVWTEYKSGDCPGHATSSFPIGGVVYNMLWNLGQDGTVAWANHDVYSLNNGTVAIKASDPIPVGTAPQLDPLSLLMGWKAGNWVARQRGSK